MQAVVIVFAVLVLSRTKTAKNGSLSKRFDRVTRIFFFLILSVTSIIFLNEFLKIHLEPQEFFKHLVGAEYPTRASWLHNPNHFAKIAFAGVLLSFYFLFRLAGPLFSTLALMQTLMWCYLTIFSQSRAAWLGALVSLFLVFILYFRLKNPRLMIAGLAGLIFVVASLGMVPSINQRFTSSFNIKSFSNRYRYEHWRANLKLILDKPLMGVGTSENRKKSVIGPYLNVEPLKKYTSNESKIYNGPHNEYLDVGSSVGLIGLLLFVLCLFIPWLQLLLNFSAKFNLLGSLSFCYMSFLYFTLIFDKVNFMHWPVLIGSWALAYIVIDKSKSEIKGSNLVG